MCVCVCIEGRGVVIFKWLRKRACGPCGGGGGLFIVPPSAGVCVCVCGVTGV